MKKVPPGMIGLFLILVIFPFVSWYYLNKGFSYSKEINEEIQVKSHIDSLSVEYFTKEYYTDSLLGKAILLLDGSSFEDDEYLALLQQQFSDNPEFVTYLHNNTNDQNLSTFKKIGDYYYQYNSPLVFEDVFETKDDAILIGTKGGIRHSYDTKEYSNWKRMARHLAFVAPISGKKDLSIKRK